MSVYKAFVWHDLYGNLHARCGKAYFNRACRMYGSSAGLRASTAVDDRIGDFEAFLGADEDFVQVALAFGGDILLRLGVG